MKSVISAIVLLLCPISFASANPYDDLMVSMGAANYYPFKTNFNSPIGGQNGSCTGGTCTFGNVVAPNVTGATANDAYTDGGGYWHNTLSASVNSTVLSGDSRAIVYWMKNSTSGGGASPIYLSQYNGGVFPWTYFGLNSTSSCPHSLMFDVNVGSSTNIYCTSTVVDDGFPHMYAQSCGNPSSPGPSPCQISVDGVLQYGGDIVSPAGTRGVVPSNVASSSNPTGGVAIFNRYITLDEARALYCAGMGLCGGGPPPTVRIIE